MALWTDSQTSVLSAKNYAMAGAPPEYGFNRATGEEHEDVVANRALASNQALGGVAMGVTGILTGLLALKLGKTKKYRRAQRTKLAHSVMHSQRSSSRRV